ncbi:hypothetical protein ACEXQE_02280 [Herbiconiux sp. P17]|uniref:DUF7426 family protein n=1 Tax=Herbiconiux wuyangfengii TaxID=3342794 RepID=UPI0035BA836E
MTELKSFEEVSDGPLAFPIKGKKYVHTLSIEAGVALAGVLSGRDKAFQKKEGVELWKLLLGPLWEEMIADGVTLEAATRAGVTALADAQYGRRFAEATWELGADPETIAKYLEGND